MRFPPNSRSIAQTFKTNEISEIALRKRGIGPNKKKDEIAEPSNPLIINTVLRSNNVNGLVVTLVSMRLVRKRPMGPLKKQIETRMDTTRASDSMSGSPTSDSLLQRVPYLFAYRHRG